jgi:hypothetical protein
LHKIISYSIGRKPQEDTRFTIQLDKPKIRKGKGKSENKDLQTGKNGNATEKSKI